MHASLTFDADEHELVEGQRAVVGHDVGGFHAAQADLAEILLAGEARQGLVGQVGFGVFRHFEKRKRTGDFKERNAAEFTHRSDIDLNLLSH